jgi:probable rRNA maturation factor
VKLSLSRSEASSPSWLDEQLAGTLQRIAGVLEHSDLSVDLVLVDDHYIQRINRDYRGLDCPTDVISFSYLDDMGSNSAPDDVAGEIFVSFETLEREANSKGLDVKNLFLRIGVHGLLHVLGFDHGSDADAEQMEREERRLLRGEMASSQVDELI